MSYIQEINLYFLNRLNSNSIDLIYLDPPFNSKRTYAAPIGTKAAGTSFKDMWTWQDVDEELLENLLIEHACLVGFVRNIEGIHGKPMMAYVVYMAQRIIEMHRVLKDTGSLYLHCDPTASHYLKIVLDKVFGRDNFRNEIIWGYKTGGVPKSGPAFGRKHDVILFYGKTKFNKFNKTTQVSYSHTLPEPHTKSGKALGMHRDEVGKYRNVSMRDWWVEYGVNKDEDVTPLYRNNKERTGYPTQKPLSLMHRIIQASSDEGDLVLDPFCGCATTCVAAQQLNRKWIGIDIEEKAVDVLTDRLEGDAGLFLDFIHTEELPVRTDIKVEEPTKNLKEELFGKQKSKCNACDNEMRIIDFEIDHIIPKSKGGSDTRDNYQLLCGSCNRIKGDRPMEYLRMKIRKRDELLSQQITFGT